MRQQPFASPGEALEHYGTKGMRWGVRKEEETGERTSTGKIVGRPSTGKIGESTSTGKTKSVAPASVSALSEKAQKRVDKFMTRSDVMGTQISELKRSNEALAGSRNPAKAYERYVNDQSIKQLDKSQQRALKDAEAVKKGKLTSTQKKMIIGGVAVAGVLAYAAVVKGQQSGALNSWQLLAQARLQGQKVPFNVNKDLARKMDASELLNHVAKPVNPGYSKAGGKMNCRRSTYAYELRRRGFDVHATTSATGWGQSESGVINALTPGAKNFYRSRSVSDAVVKTGTSSVARGDTRLTPVKKILVDGLVNKDLLRSATASSSQKVLEELAKQPNGARGEVLFKFPSFGHSMAYEIVDGKPHIFDSQKGTLYNAATKMVESKWDGFNGAEITRLDNVELDYNFLSRWADNN